MVPVYADGGSPDSPTMSASAFPVSPEKQSVLGIRFEPADITPGTQVIRAGARVAYDQSETVLIADVYEYEATALQIGQRARVSRPYPPRREFWATVDFLYPRLDPISRTLKVRLNAGDIGVKLIPDTFLNVEFHITGRPALTVPADAILNTGLQKIVFVDLGNSQIEPREVETGRRLGDRVEVTRGLRRGERVAVSGAFLLDSESRLKMPSRQESTATRNIHNTTPGEARVNSATGMPLQVDQPSKAPFRDASKMATDSNPLQTGNAIQQDPVCGMEVDTMNAGMRKSAYGGKTYYFCSKACKDQFDANPTAYVKESEHEPASKVQPPPVHTHSDGSLPDAAAAAAGPQPVIPGEPWNNAMAKPGVKHIDPVCGKAVDEQNARVRIGVGRALVREYEGHLFYFCSVQCKREFDMNPEYYGRKALGTLETGQPQKPAVRSKTK